MKKIVFVTICTLLCIVSKAQLVYQNNYLTFNGNQYDNSYSTTWTGWAHAWVNSTNPDRHLTFVMSTVDPRISSGSGTIAFYRSGYGYNSIKVKDVYNASDISLKSNIQSLNNATSIVMKLRPVTYNMDFKRANSNVYLEDNKEYGFIAQEIEAIMPEIVVEDDEGLKLVNYMAIIPILTAVIQEQNKRIADLEKKVDELAK